MTVVQDALEPNAKNMPLCKKELYDFHKFFYYRESLGLTTNVYIAVKYHKLPSLPDLYKALIDLVEKNPVLGLQIFADDADAEINTPELHDDDGKPYRADPPRSVHFAQVTEFDFSQIVQVRDTLDINDTAALELFLGKKFEYGRYDKPCWEMFILKDNWMVFKFDHLALDGMSGVNVHKHIIEFLNKNANDSDLKDKNGFGDSGIYHPKLYTDSEKFDIEWVFEKPKMSAYFLATKLLPTLIRPKLISSVNYLVNKFSLNPSILGNVYQFKCDPAKYVIQCNKFIDNHLQINISPKDVSKLIKLGKKTGAGISMNSIICSLMSVATKNIMVRKEQAINISIPVNCRPTCNVDPRKIGLLVKGLELTTPVLNSDLLTSTTPSSSSCSSVSDLNIDQFWTFASGIQQEVNRAAPSREGIENVNMLSLVDIMDFIKGKQGVPPDSTFEVSNLGIQFNDKIFSDRANKYHIEDAIFNQCLGISNCFTISSIATLESGTNMDIMYPNELKHEVEEVIKNFKKHLTTLLALSDS